MQGIFSSVRFWLIVLIAALQIAVVLKWIDGTQAESIVQIIQGVLASIIAVRTVDRTGDKKVEAANQ